MRDVFFDAEAYLKYGIPHLNHFIVVGICEIWYNTAS